MQRFRHPRRALYLVPATRGHHAHAMRRLGALPRRLVLVAVLVSLGGLGGLARLMAFPAGVTLAAPATSIIPGAPLTAAFPAPVSVSVLACTSGHVESYAQTLVVRATQWVCGDVDAYGSGIVVLGRVTGNVTAFGGNVQINGQVAGNVLAIGGDVVLEPGARVAGDVAAWGGTTRRASDVLVDGTIDRGDRVVSALGAKWVGTAGIWSFPWPWVLAWSAIAAIIITLLPERTARVRVVARRAAVRSVAVGILTTVLGVVLIAVLFASCIGIPISLAVTAVLLAGWLLGTVAVGLWLGDVLLRLVAPRAHSRLLPALLGIVLLTSLESIPCVGGAIAVLASSLGLGAALLSRFGGRRATALPPAADIAPARARPALREREPA